jgi:hypothetical protein
MNLEDLTQCVLLYWYNSADTDTRRAAADLHLNLEDPTRCMTQLGATYELPRSCAHTQEGPSFLAGSSPFEVPVKTKVYK